MGNKEESSSSEEDSEDEPAGGKALLDRHLYSLQGELPKELPSATERDKELGLYVSHFIRYVAGAWIHALASGEKFEEANLTWQTKEILRDEAKLQETIVALRPLLQRLRNREI